MKLPSVISYNWRMKAIALTLALMLEFYFYSPDNSVTKSLPALITIRNLPGSMMVVDPPNGRNGIEAEIEVSGPRPLVEQMSSRIFEIETDAPLSILPGMFALRVNPEDVGVPSGVEVRQIIPVASKIRVEERAGKELLVVVETTGAPKEGFVLKKVEVFPSTVVVRGPQSRIEQLAAVETLSVDISGVSQSFSRELSIKPQGALIDVGVTLVTVKIEIEPKQSVKTVKNVQVRLLAPQGAAATVEGSTKASIDISGPEKFLESLTSEQLKLIVDARDLDAGFHQVEITGELPEGVSLVRVEPKTLAITIRGQNGEAIRN